MPFLTILAQDEIPALVARGELLLAQQQAQQAVQRSPKDPVAWQILGLIFAATGKLAEAEQAFSHALEEGETRNVTTTGLERELILGRPLGKALGKLKPLFFAEAGIAAARNNRGAVRLLLGKLALAQEDLDYAAVAAPESPLPWLNATVVLMERNLLDQAELSAQGALQRAPELGRGLAIRAELELARGQARLALDDSEAALRRAPEDAHVLLVHSRVLRALARERDADRSLLQALALQPTIAADSRSVPQGGKFSAKGGNATEQHAQLTVFRSSTQGILELHSERIQQQVEARSRAEQVAERFEAVFGVPEKHFAGYAALRRSAGGRPGATVSRFGVAPQPETTFRLNQEQVLLLQTNQALTWHLGWHRDAVVRQSSPDSPAVWPLQDERLSLEGRWKKEDFQAGVSWSQNQRRQQGFEGALYTSSPIEPAEQLLPAGTWRQGLAWAFAHKTLSPNLALTAGPVALQTRRRLVAQPFVDLEIRGIVPKPTHFRIRPRVAEAAGELFPDQARAASPQENLIDRHESSAQTRNRSPLLAGSQGRIQESSFSVPMERRGVAFQSTLFHHRMENVFAQAADPRAAPTLSLTSITEAEAFGVAQEARWRLGQGLTAQALVRYQEAYGHVDSQTLSGATYPARIPQLPRGLSNFPRWQGGLRLDHVSKKGSLGLELPYVGPRPFWVTVRSASGTPDTYLSKAAAATGLNIHVTHRFSHEATLNLSLFNLTKANFYPGYPGAVTALSGAFWRF